MYREVPSLTLLAVGGASAVQKQEAMGLAVNKAFCVRKNTCIHSVLKADICHSVTAVNTMMID